jgi:hypothetical protein
MRREVMVGRWEERRINGGSMEFVGIEGVTGVGVNPWRREKRGVE